MKGTPFNTVDPADAAAAVENKVRVASLPVCLRQCKPSYQPPTIRHTTSNQALAGLSVFERAVADFNSKYPAVAARGLGPSTKAERWNGRHAMVCFCVAQRGMKGRRCITY